MARVTSEFINRQNKITILNLIRQEGTISRAEIAKKTGISAPTVTRIVDSLINSENLVREAGEGSSSGGRRPNLISFAGEKHFVIGIDLSPRFISGILTDLNSKIRTEIRIPTFASDGFGPIMERTGGLVSDLISQARVPESELIGIGLGVAGFIDMHNDILLTSPNFGWTNVHPDRELAKHTSLPVVYDNLTRVMALGELHYGAGSRYDNFICLKLGMGLGAGVIQGRKPFYGSHGCGSESGHTIIDWKSSYECTCGNRGCFEALVSGHYVLKRVEEILTAENAAAILNQPDPLASAIQAMKKEPAVFSALLDELVNHLSIGILNQIHSYDPQAVVLGGLIAELGPLLIDPVRERVQSMVIPQLPGNYEICLVEYGDKAVAMGAVALVLDQVLELKM